jgi:hypothetical protein
LFGGIRGVEKLVDLCLVHFFDNLGATLDGVEEIGKYVWDFFEISAVFQVFFTLFCLQISDWTALDLGLMIEIFNCLS